MADIDITKAHIQQCLHFAVDTRNVLEELGGILHGHLQHIGNALAFIFNFQRLPVVAFAFAYFTRYIDIRQEVHFNLNDSVPAASLTAPALHVKAEPALLEAAYLGLIGFGE
ncbi:hypothetical protein D3C80_1791390 [compost metagenome]